MKRSSSHKPNSRWCPRAAQKDAAHRHGADDADRGDVPEVDAAADAIVGPREVIRQAGRDIGAGLIDTDRRRVPDIVPGPHIATDETPGAQVPPGGVDREK